MEQPLLRRLTGISSAHRARGRLTWGIAAVAILVSLGGVALRLAYAATTGDASGILSHVAFNPFLTITYAVIGALVAAHHRRNPIGWLFLTVAAIFALNIGAAAAGDYVAIIAREPQLARPAFVRWLDNWFWLPGVVLPTVFIMLLFPDGRPLSPRWRIVLWAGLLGMSALMAALALHPGPLPSWGTAANPYGIPGATPILDVLLNTGGSLLLAGFVGSVVAFALRYRRAEGQTRIQMKWLLYAIVIMIIAHLAVAVAWFTFRGASWVGELSIAVSSLSVLGIALAAAIAILRYRLYDIDLVVNRTLVYGALSASIVLIYVLVVAGLGWLFQDRGNPLLGLLATGLVAVLFQPLRDRLQRAVNRLFYGQRDDPLAALSQLGRRLELALAPDVVLPSLVETIAQTMRLPYVAIRWQTASGKRLAAHTGDAVAAPLSLALIYQGETIGDLLVAPRAPGEPFSSDDHRLLQQIAHQAGPAVHALQLTAALQQSRRQLVSAREEERRRLRRDLHDGLGAALAGLHLQAGVLRRLIDSNPRQAEALVDEWRADIRATIDEIRRLVYELRPPTLDQLGLAAAVRALAAASSRASDAVQIHVEAPDELPPLPAAVEVAAYRIVQEALTNVTHHAHARQCLVRLQANAELLIQIDDDGLGLPRDNGARQGMGLLSMRERAAELGGSCHITSLPGGGARVQARLPLSEETTGMQSSD